MFSNPSMFGTSLFGSATGDPEKHAQLLALITEGRSSYEIATACQGVKAATINLVPKDGVAPPLLHAAAAANAADSVQALLTAKADVNLGDTSGATALFIAAKNDAVNVLEKLMVVPHVDLNKPRKSGATPVYVATQNNALGCLRALLDAGADPDASKEGGFTPSSVACLRGNEECLSLLVEAGASVDRASSVADRFTPLHLAANGGLDSILKILLEAGASIRLRDSQGKTAKELSKAAGHTVCTAMLTAAEGGERREEVLAQQEQLVQDLRQMPPGAHADSRATRPPEQVREALEVPATTLEALSTALASLSSEMMIGQVAADLQSAASLLTQAVLPARRLGEQLASLDEEAASLEAASRDASRRLQQAQQHVLESPDDEAAVGAREAMRKRYAGALSALQDKYEERQRYGQKLASAYERVASTAPSLMPATPAADGATVDTKGLTEAAAKALPVLKRASNDVGEAHRATLAAMGTLQACLARELELLARVRQPLLDAKQSCTVAVQLAATQLSTEPPIAGELAQLTLLIGQVKGKQHALEASRAALLEAKAAPSARSLSNPLIVEYYPEAAPTIPPESDDPDTAAAMALSTVLTALSAAATLVPGAELSTLEPPLVLLPRVFLASAAVATPVEARLFESAEGGCTLLPLADGAAGGVGGGGSVTEVYENLGRLLGYAAARGQKVHTALVTKRQAALSALRAGVASQLGGEGALAAMAPHELAVKMLGAALPEFLPGLGDDGEAPTGSGLVFDRADWEADEMRISYAQWLRAWDQTLSPPQRCAVLLRVFGAVSGGALRVRMCVLPSALESPLFVPEGGQLYLPMACSLDEFTTRMHPAALTL
ncbi:ankyrin repeat domain protein [Chrysochromulina tobinii]|uniref:Ankyrin repeat domain protein n=1 Tax=Chrysochromulina tobinii TaxID=1460289 RepID=A0A0M0JX03_9EUKA|nr:ankyrin repeat domain protein [Chrysochromulina tobinii]|eukprot:KOO31186.1 ankyrin repeat domain protein [Chrysochromulina sp. CCMP291]